jgi:glutaredoxin 3
MSPSQGLDGVSITPSRTEFCLQNKYDIIRVLEDNYLIFMHNVTIFSTPTCHFCHMAKDFFKANNIAYTEHDVASDLEQRKIMVEKSGQMGVPVILIDDTLTVGFDKPKIAKALGLI